MAEIPNHHSDALTALENESIFIIREVVATFRNPVLLYSVGKDSSVLLRLIEKAFAPTPIPIPLMHIDTGYKFPEMYQFRDQTVQRLGLRLIVETNSGSTNPIHPLVHGLDQCCAQLKTSALLAALAKHNFDGAIGGARRDEEKSRAKERIFSIRDSHGQWNPKSQRPEIWNLYNTKLKTGQTARIFPLSNWTEQDIWRYIEKEEIPIVPLYHAKKRSVIDNNGVLIPSEYKDIAFGGGPIQGEEKELFCRFRSLGCIPCTGAVESRAESLQEIISELNDSELSERANRLIDHTGDSSMEDKKKGGYF